MVDRKIHPHFGHTPIKRRTEADVAWLRHHHIARTMPSAHGFAGGAGLQNPYVSTNPEPVLGTGLVDTSQRVRTHERLSGDR
jgi:hypothetical protein